MRKVLLHFAALLAAFVCFQTSFAQAKANVLTVAENDAAKNLAKQQNAIYLDRVINKNANELPQPICPANIGVCAGVVKVLAFVNLDGNVIDAQAISGDAKLYDSALIAARNTKFSPTQINGKPITVAGVLAYDFSKAKQVQTPQAQEQTPGLLQATNKNGKSLGLCPLKHTDVKAEVSGFLSRVRVRQEFENNFNERIEAVYIFPLPNMSAVDEMTMRVGERTIKGKILKRGEAREVYETAKNQGQTAALLDQERPNVFTQAVANIQPGEKVTIEISYVETLKYENGAYEFLFPTVVAPRYNPANVKNTPAEIKQTLAPKNTRAGHDVSIAIDLDAGVPLENVVSKSHEIETTRLSNNRAVVKLKDLNEIPNRDFILNFDVSGRRIEDAILTHKDERGGYFTFILQPPDKLAAEDITPKEIVFVLDTSGSMNGFPIEKAKEAMRLALDNLNPLDTFNLITFAGDTEVLFDKPVPATRANMRRAKEFLETRNGSGGTEMMTAIKAALEPTDSQTHVRIVCFMTDGLVGNEAQIISEVQKHPNARVFSFGIGSSTNRYLLEKIAQEGRGEAEFVALDDDGSAAAKRFHERVRTPILTDVAIDWNNLPLTDVYPRRINDLFSAKPLVIHGRYTKAATGAIKLTGKIGGQIWEREIKIELPETETAHDTLATLWARTRIDDLTNRDLNAAAKPEIEQTITNLGLEYRLLTQFTSFVAVEEKTVTENGKPRRVEVPVETPQGVNREMVASDEYEMLMSGAATSATVEVTASPRKDRKIKARTAKSPARSARGNGIGTGIGSGVGYGRGSGIGNGTGAPPPPKPNTPVAISGVTLSKTANSPAIVSGGVINGKAKNLVQPGYPPAGKAVRASGAVSVQVVIDESGNVISASATGGHPLLRAAAVQAAGASQFAPTQLSGQPVKVTGVIVYNFNAEQQKGVPVVGQLNAAPDLTDAEAQKKAESSAAELQRLEIDRKLHERIAALLDKIEQGDKNFVEFAFAADDKADVFVELERFTPAALDELRANGFEINKQYDKNKLVAGRIAFDKIRALALLDNVRLVAPQR